MLATITRTDDSQVYVSGVGPEHVLTNGGALIRGDWRPDNRASGAAAMAQQVLADVRAEQVVWISGAVSKRVPFA